MKCIILAGGYGTRLSPLTIDNSKQLLPVYNKPMIYYPLSLMILSGIKEFAIICLPKYLDRYKNLIGNGSDLGIDIQYFLQEKPNGIPECFKICEEFIKEDSTILILGDNIFFGSNFHNVIKNSIKSHKDGAKIFLYTLNNPSSYGVCKIKNDKIVEIKEKPKKFISDKVITGLYIFDNKAIKLSKQCKLSKKGETEIVELLSFYLKKKKLKFYNIGRGTSWFDAGTFDNLFECQSIIKNFENRQSILIGSPHEASFRKGYISKKDISKITIKNKNSSYFKALEKLKNK